MSSAKFGEVSSEFGKAFFKSLEELEAAATQRLRMHIALLTDLAFENIDEADNVVKAIRWHVGKVIFRVY